MIIGVDFGNFNTKTSENLIFPSKICRDENVIKFRLEDDPNLVIYEGIKYLVGEGNLQTDPNKLDKDMFKTCVLTAIGKSTSEEEARVVLGVPNNQYTTKNIERIKSELLADRIYNIKIAGKDKTFIISDIEIYAEGLAPYYGMSKEQREEVKFKDLIIVNIGGGNTNISYFKMEGNKRNLGKSSTVPGGVINLYDDFINAVNGELSINKELEDAENILQYGIEIFGEKQDLSFTKDIILTHIDRIFKELNLYPVKTSKIMFTGGGSKVLKALLKKRIPNCIFQTNYMLATAMGFKRVGESLWQER